jgi:5-methylthioadenosine/S-adenosylhomocysteine deaminase
VSTLSIRGAFIDGTPRTIHVENGKIESLGVDLPADRVIEAAGLYAFPSLKNAHTHAGMTLFRGYGDDLPLMEWLQTKIWPAELMLTEEDVYHGTRLALLEMLKGGTTWLADMYWHRDGVARAVRDMGMKGHIASVFIDLGDQDKAKEQCDRTLDRLAESDKFGPRVKMALGPHAIYTVSNESLEWIGRLAEAEDLIVHIHLSETKGEVADCKKQHGTTPARLLDRLGLVGRNLVAAHGIYLDEEERAMLAEAGATVVTNPVSNLKLAVGDIFPYREAREAGLRVALGTDGAGSNNNLDLIEEMKIAALVQKHRTGDPTCLPAREALGLATTAPAEAFGLGSGRIEPGAPAALMLVDLGAPSTQPVHDPVSNLVYAANASAVHTTICDGEVLMHDRIVEVVDEEEVIREATAAARNLFRRVAEGGGA